MTNNSFSYTGLFISPSGISELDCATTKTDTAERSISTERERHSKFLSYLTGARCVHPWWLLRAPGKRFSHTLDSLSRWARTACSFRSAQTATLLEFHVPFTNCFVCRWFCVVHDPKPPLHRHNWLSFGKFQGTERFLIHYERHFSSRLHHSGGTCKYAKAPSTKITWRDSLPIDMLLSAVSVLVIAQSSSEIPEGLMNNPVYIYIYIYIYIYMCVCVCVCVCVYTHTHTFWTFAKKWAWVKNPRAAAWQKMCGSTEGMMVDRIF